MTKYEEICSAYATARQQWVEHRQACRAFVTDLAQKLVEDIGIAREDILFVPPNVECSPSELQSVEGALRYGADGAFHFGLGLRVWAAVDNPLTEILLLQVSLARNPGGFELRIAGLHEPIRIPMEFEAMSKGHRAFLDIIAKRAITTYTEHDLRYTELTDNPRMLLR